MTYRQVTCRQTRPRFQPQCSHLTMTRLYGTDFLCESCHRPGPFGWVYRCTQDREELIEEAVARGFTTAFDDLGYVLSEALGTRKGSPAARKDGLSFLTEVTPEQLASYRPEHLAVILKQREDLQSEIHEEQIQQAKAAVLRQFRQTTLRDDGFYSPNSKPGGRWTCDDDEECQFKVCPFCRPSYADRAFLSLNAVAAGEVLPTAATGFGFHVLGERPVVDANIVGQLGLRPPPPPRSESTYDASSYTSDLSMMEMLDDQLRQCGASDGRYRDTTGSDQGILSLLPSIPGQLTHSRGYDNLKECEHLSRDNEAQEPPDEGLVKEPCEASPQGEQERAHQSLNGFKIDCVVMDHVGSVSSPDPEEGTDFLIKISGPRAEPSQHP